MLETACSGIPLVFVVGWIIRQKRCPITTFPRFARIIIIPFTTAICNHIPNEAREKTDHGYEHQYTDALAYPSEYRPHNFLHSYFSIGKGSSFLYRWPHSLHTQSSSLSKSSGIQHHPNIISPREAASNNSCDGYP